MLHILSSFLTRRKFPSLGSGYTTHLAALTARKAGSFPFRVSRTPWRAKAAFKMRPSPGEVIAPPSTYVLRRLDRLSLHLSGLRSCCSNYSQRSAWRVALSTSMWLAARTLSPHVAASFRNTLNGGAREDAAANPLRFSTCDVRYDERGRLVS